MKNNFNFDKLEEFDNHYLIQFILDKKVGLRGFIAIHRRNNNKPSLGATRLWKYPTDLDALRDCLRLAKIMSYKSILAGLPYGGAKAVLISSSQTEKQRLKFLAEYAKRLNDLKGLFVTGADIGIDNKDVKMMKKYTEYIIGVKVDPAYYTAVGVYYGIKQCLEHLFGSSDITNRSFAIQGMGKTGQHLLRLIYPRAREIFITDINKKSLKTIKRQFSRVKVVSPTQIIKQKVDVFCPCAVGSVLNSKNAVLLKAKIIAGSANNQLESDYVDSLLYKLGILYAPDFVINAGGLISVVDEMEHNKPSKKRIFEKLKCIPANLKYILSRSEKQKKPTGFIANQIARKRLSFS